MLLAWTPCGCYGHGRTLAYSRVFPYVSPSLCSQRSPVRLCFCSCVFSWTDLGVTKEDFLNKEPNFLKILTIEWKTDHEFAYMMAFNRWKLHPGTSAFSAPKPQPKFPASCLHLSLCPSLLTSSQFSCLLATTPPPVCSSACWQSAF